MPDEPESLLPRREIYKGAGRTFPYLLYLSMNIVWIAAVVALLLADILSPQTLVRNALAVLIAVIAILHSVKMTMARPWLVVRSFIVGVAVLCAAWILHQLFDLPTHPLALSAIVFSAHYLWVGERWTVELYRRQALVKFAAEWKQKREIAAGDC